MRHLLLFAHLLGIALWLGGGFVAMNLGITMRTSPSRDDLAVLARVQGRVHRAVILPGCLLAVLSGLLLTLRLYGGPVSSAGFPVSLMVMQGAGLLAAGLALGVNIPTTARLARLDPIGPQAALFGALLKRAGLAGGLTGLLVLVALIAGVLWR